MQRVPEIEFFIRNLVKTNPRIQLPAIMHAIASMFSREGVSETDIDREVCEFINEIIGENANDFNDISYNNLGLGVGTKNDLGMDDDGDVWKGLTPNNNN